MHFDSAYWIFGRYNHDLTVGDKNQGRTEIYFCPFWSVQSSWPGALFPSGTITKVTRICVHWTEHQDYIALSPKWHTSVATHTGRRSNFTTRKRIAKQLQRKSIDEKYFCFFCFFFDFLKNFRIFDFSKNFRIFDFSKNFNWNPSIKFSIFFDLKKYFWSVFDQV